MRAAVYHRCSTSTQDNESQQHAIDQWVLAHPAYSGYRLFQDEGISGKTDKRPGFQALCQAVEAGEIDAVIAFRLDRLSRNAMTALQLLLKWMQSDVEFFAVDQPILQLARNNPLRLTVTAMMAEFAAMEHAAIVSRVKAGLRAAQARGVQLGKPCKLTPTQITWAKGRIKAGDTQQQVAARLHVSQPVLSRAIKRQQEVAS